jgi:iron-sulfur cluster assembly accessory protein
MSKCAGRRLSRNVTRLPQGLQVQTLKPRTRNVHYGVHSVKMESLEIAAEDAAAEAKEVMISLTPVASSKVKEIMSMQTPVPSALRVAVVGGGCSGFQYHMAFENQTNDTDEVVDFDGLKVAVDQMSSMYLEGVEIDYIETLDGAGFKFNNPNVKSTCGCGSSFSV